MASKPGSSLIHGIGPAGTPLPLQATAAGKLETTASLAGSVTDVDVNPDNIYKLYDDAAGSGATRTETIRVDFEAFAAVTTASVRSVQILLKDTASPVGTEIGSVKFKTSVIGVFGDAIPLFNEQADTFVVSADEIELTLTADATTRSIVYASGLKES